VDHAKLLRLSTDYLAQYLRKIRACLDLLTEDQVWWRPHPRCNSVGNLLLHLRGNVSQWILGGLGGEPIKRERSLEFTADRTAPKAELLAGLGGIVERAQAVITGLGEQDLAAPRSLQGYETDGLGVVLHVVEHMSYHTGQIVFVAKQLAGEETELEFYPQRRRE